MLARVVGNTRRIAAAFCIVAASACGHFGMGGSAPADGLIVFHNESLDQADVYAVAPGSSFERIGTVFPGRADTLRIRSSILTQGSGVNIVARLLARSNTPSSGMIPLHSGDMFDVRLTADGTQIVALPSMSR
jgi:hypothetical protein